MNDIDAMIARAEAELSNRKGGIDKAIAEAEALLATRRGQKPVNPTVSAMFPADPLQAQIGTVADRATQPGMSPDAQAQFQAQADERNIAANPIASRAAKFYQGLPFVGQYADEAVGLIAGEQQAEGMRRAQAAMDRQRPGQAMALEVAGGITGTIPLVAAFAPAVAATAPGNLLGQTISAATVAGGGAALEGAINQFGRGEGMDERMENAKQGALLGGGLGAVLGAAAPLASASIRNLATYIRGVDTTAIAKELGVSTDAAKIIKGHLVNEDIDAARAALRRVGKDAMLADAGESTAQLLDTSMATGGRALTIGRDAVDARAEKSAGILNKTFDRILGAPEGAKTAAKGISRRTAAARQAAYDAAYSRPIDYAGAGRKIEDVLQRVPSSAMKSAISEANEAMQEAGLRNMQIMATIGDDGSVVFREMPNVRQLDELKRALGKVANDNVDTFGRLNGAGIRYNRLAGDLRDAIKDAVPEYGRAVKLGGDKISEDDALRLGRDVLSRATKREDVIQWAKGSPSVEAKDAFKKGVRGAIDDMMAEAKSLAADPNVDIQEARKAIKAMSDRANREKIAAAIGKKEAATLFKALDQEGAKLLTRARVARTTATAVRQSGQRAIDDITRPGVVGELQAGEIVGATKRLVQSLTGKTPEAKAARTAGTYAEISSLLTKSRGKDAERALMIIKNAMDGRALSQAQARLVARAVTNAGGSTAYQSSVQSLESR